MLRTVQHTIQKHALLRAGDHVLIAVSGGADSVAMAYALHFLKKQYRISITPAHLNHRIRGRAAEQDAQFVNELAWRLGLPCVQGRTDVPRMARERGVSLEMAARESRYDFLERTAREVGANCIATAHTADDQVETVLLKLTRGAGPQGVSGIPYSAAQRGVRIIRPCRDVTHAEVVRFLRRHGLIWREDKSNMDMTFLRNRVRHQVLPLLESKLNPQVRRAILRAAELLREENEWLDSIARGLWSECAESGQRGDLNVQKLNGLPLAGRRRVLRLWLVAGGVDSDQLGFETIENIERLLVSARGTRAVPISGALRVVRRYRSLALETNAVAAGGAFSEKIAVPGETILPDQGLRIITKWATGIIRERGGRAGDLPAAASLGAEAMRHSPLRVRSWKAGDRIRPLGMSGSCKLQDLFVDQKVPRDSRDRIPVFECRGDIVWIPGYRIASGWEVKDPRAPSLHIYVRQV
jgi:tRNA(Ile)-lysidine synthase